MTLVGDVRQATYRTSYAPKNKQFCGRGFVKKVDAWKKAGLCDVKYLAKSRRCVQQICDFADLIFPDFPQTLSENGRRTGHDGVFAVRAADIAEYQRRYSPQLLRLNKRFRPELAAENFGMVKGAGFERVLIVPYSGITKWLETGGSASVSGSADEVYVGITRAFQSVAIVHDGTIRVPGVSLFDPLKPC